MDIMLTRSGSALLPATSEDEDTIRALNENKFYGCTLTQLRNGGFHRKTFDLLRFAYENSERITHEYRGQVIGQSFNSFREGIVIMAGYHHIDVLSCGGLTYRGQSLSYKDCSQELIEKIYHDVLDVICQKVFTDERYTKGELERVSDRLSGYV